MPERNNRRRKKLSYLLVYNLVVEIKKPIQTKNPKTRSQDYLEPTFCQMCAFRT